MFSYYVEIWTVNGWIGFGIYTSLSALRAETKGKALRVWRMSRGLYRDGLSPYGWDAPTFKAQAELVRSDDVPACLQA